MIVTNAELASNVNEETPKPDAKSGSKTLTILGCIVVAAVGVGAGILLRQDSPPSEGTLPGNSTSTNGSPNLPDTPPLFEDATKRAGLDFTHTGGGFVDYFMPSTVTGGSAFFDYDRDGDLDIFLINATTNQRVKDNKESAPFTDEEKSNLSAAEMPTNRLFEQRAPMEFVDVTEASGLGDAGYGMGVATGDINNDGYPDLFLTNFGPNRLYINNGDGTF
ncbi:MAG: hypothetical protein CMJ78_06275, partial [Planctomycetaceae bacterium]|nr:hypothetical protein [Planctomycetaceae bacterium]